MGFTHKITYKNHHGSLDPETGLVKFYYKTYKTINDAIKLEKILKKDYKRSMFKINKLEIPRPKIVSLRSFRTQYES